MSTVDFYFEGQNITVQCYKYDKMKQIFQSFYSKSGINPNSLTFIYNGEIITNGEATFEQTANSDDKNRNKMNLLVANSPNSASSEFIFENVIGADESMKDFAKMVILLAMKEHPEDDDSKIDLIHEKFKERYEGSWSCSIYKIGYGSSIFNVFGCFMRIKYGNYIIKIAKTSQ